jgi:hypothetical protein
MAIITDGNALAGSFPSTRVLCETLSMETVGFSQVSVSSLIYKAHFAKNLFATASDSSVVRSVSVRGEQPGSNFH